MIRNKKIQNRIKRHRRVRKDVSGKASKPRIAVFRSNKHIFVQAVDDVAQVTIIGVSDKSITKGTKTEKATELGKAFGKQLVSKKITEAVFDRGGFKYHGRVKAVADGIREAGVKI